MELFEIVTWVKFNKPGLKEEVLEIGKTCKDSFEFKEKLQEKYQIDALTAMTIVKNFYKK